MTVRENPEFMKRFTEAAGRGVIAGANVVRNKMLSLITDTPKTGVTYRRRGVVRTRSADGEPYADDTGNTRAQIDEPVLDGTRATIVLRGANARRLELGTENMEPRPVAVPALNASREEVDRIVREEIMAEFKT